jgi:hypothetical protein
MAVFLHPHYKISWFKKHWDVHECNKALDYIEEQYNLTKARLGAGAVVRDPRPRQPTELNAYDTYNRLSSPNEDEADDLYRYKSEKIVAFGIDPLQWWSANGDQYPVLKHLALTLLAAPPSSAACERLFSIAGNVVNEERPHTQARLAQAVQCLRSWHEQALI